VRSKTALTVIGTLVFSSVGGSSIGVSSVGAGAARAQETNNTPIYTDPPPTTDPLPSERPFEPNPISQDFQVGALQQDFTGDLWVGSHQGLGRVDPETGQVLARVNVPNRFIDAMV